MKDSNKEALKAEAAKRFRQFIIGEVISGLVVVGAAFWAIKDNTGLELDSPAFFLIIAALVISTLLVFRWLFVVSRLSKAEEANKKTVNRS